MERCAMSPHNVLRFPVRFRVRFDDTLQTEFIIYCSGLGVSFTSTASIAGFFRSVCCDLVNLDDISREKVSLTVRSVVGRGLHCLSMILGAVDVYGIAVDAAKSLKDFHVFELRTRVPLHGDIEELHIATIPLKNERAKTLFFVVRDMLDALDPNWRYKTGSYSSDGAPAVRSTLRGCAGYMILACRPCGGTLYTVWCGLHRSALVVKKSLAVCSTTTPASEYEGTMAGQALQPNGVEDLDLTALEDVEEPAYGETAAELVGDGSLSDEEGNDTEDEDDTDDGVSESLTECMCVCVCVCATYDVHACVCAWTCMRARVLAR
eukprot:GHVU01196475.1.p1 GENE.GHVU01196475.1~~GHVU01196475.1.p1  ORF type:complete len:321 (-),score=43.60 GHVU01196475.1:14-976(-)